MPIGFDLLQASHVEMLSNIRWRPGIGDPSVMGWLTVAAYAIAAALAGLAWANPASGKRQAIWLWVSAFMICLCINKQLDLQSLLTDIGRLSAYQGGWYKKRRSFQKWFVVSLLAGSGVFSVWFSWRFREFVSTHKLLTAGLISLTTFILVRAISFHHLDLFLNTRLLEIKVNWALELGGICLIGVAAWRGRL